MCIQSLIQSIFLIYIIITLFSNFQNSLECFGCTIEYDEFYKHRDDIIKAGNRSDTATVMGEITQILALYQFQHGMKTIEKETNDQICKRKFIVNRQGRLACDGDASATLEGAGSTTKSFLSDLVAAVVLNRTFILGPHDKLDKKCNMFFRLRNWIPNYYYIDKRVHDANCSKNIISKNKHFGVCTVFNDKIDENRFYRNRLDKLFPLPLSSEVSETYRYRFGFGMLFRAAFKFTSNAHELINPLVEDAYYSHRNRSICMKHSDVLTIAVHLRHMNANSIKDPSIDEEFDMKALQYIYNISESKAYSSCYIYVSSDRQASLRMVENYANSIHCEVRMSPRQNIKDPSLSLPDPITEHGKLNTLFVFIPKI